MLERMRRNWNSHTLLVGLQIGTATIKNSMERLIKVRIDLPYDSAISLLGIYPKDLKTHIRKDICTPVFIAALFAVARTRKQLKCPTINDWLKKLWHIYTMEYYSAIRRDKILPFATTWMDLEIIMLSKISQTQKAENHMISYDFQLFLPGLFHLA